MIVITRVLVIITNSQSFEKGNNDLRTYCVILGHGLYMGIYPTIYKYDYIYIYDCILLSVRPVQGVCAFLFPHSFSGNIWRSARSRLSGATSATACASCPAGTYQGLLPAVCQQMLQCASSKLCEYRQCERKKLQWLHLVWKNLRIWMPLNSPHVLWIAFWRFCCVYVNP